MTLEFSKSKWKAAPVEERTAYVYDPDGVWMKEGDTYSLDFTLRLARAVGKAVHIRNVRLVYEIDQVQK